MHVEAHKKIAAYWKRHDFIWGKFLSASNSAAGGLLPVKFGETRYASWFSVIERNLKLKEIYKNVGNDLEVSCCYDCFLFIV